MYYTHREKIERKNGESFSFFFFFFLPYFFVSLRIHNDDINFILTGVVDAACTEERRNVIDWFLSVVNATINIIWLANSGWKIWWRDGKKNTKQAFPRLLSPEKKKKIRIMMATTYNAWSYIHSTCSCYYHSLQLDCFFSLFSKMRTDTCCRAPAFRTSRSCH